MENRRRCINVLDNNFGIYLNDGSFPMCQLIASGKEMKLQNAFFFRTQAVGMLIFVDERLV